MKKNIMRILSLVVVAAMLFATASCTQTILVRFVDKDGNDVFIGTQVSPAAEAPASQAPAAEAPASQAPVADTPTAAPASEAPTAAPAAEAPASEAPAAETPASEAPAAETPASEAPASEAPAASGMPTGVNAIADFYKAAVNKVKNDGAAGYTKKEYQTLGNFNITGNAGIDGQVGNVIGGFMTKEEDAEDQVNALGSDEAKSRFPGFTLTDYSKIASATCTQNGSGNYDIEIIMVDEDTPTKSNSFLTQVTNSLLLWEDIDDTLKNDKTVSALLKSYDGVHIIYKGYSIKAEITPDGKFVTLNHTANVDIQIGSAKILIITLTNKSAHMDNYCKYWNFQY